MYFGRRSRFALLAAATAACAAALIASPAWAHVEVSADNAQAGARNVTLTFVGEAESTKAGIASEQVVLPAGISPQDVRLGKAPDGWTFTTTADGYTVAGKALPVGEDATYSVVVAQLPADATELVFKTLETYGDGSVQRWIEVPAAGQAEPENPAPVLKLSPAAPATTSAAATSAAAAPSVTMAASSPASAATTPGSGSGFGWWIAAIVVVLLGAIAAVFVVRRRRQSPPPPSS